MGRAAVTLLLLASVMAVACPLPSAAAAASDAAEGASLSVRIVESPVEADPTGAPFLVLVEIRGPPGGEVEPRLQAGPPAQPVTRTWSGFGWQRSDRYLPPVPLDADGTWRGFLQARAKPDTPEGETVLLVKARSGTRTAEASERIAFRAGGPPQWGPAPVEASAVALVRGNELRVLSPVENRAFALTGEGTLLRFLDARGHPVASRPVPPSLAPPRITEVTPRAFGDGGGDHVILKNPGPETVPLAGLCLETAAEPACFHEGELEAGVRLAVARNASRYERENGRPPDLEMPLHLPDKGGRIALSVAGHALDAVEYPRVAPGEVWTPDPHDRHRRVGWSRFGVEALSVAGNFTPFVTPGEGTPAVLGFVDAARERLDVAVYTLEAPHLASALARAADRGVHVRLLLEGAPVGGMRPDERAGLRHLLAHGVDVRLMTGVEDRPARYLNMHAKYATRDGESLLVASENWNPGAYPPGPRSAGGNRGWGLVVENRTLATWFQGVFEADFTGADLTRPDVEDAPAFRLTPSPPFEVRLQPLSLEARVTPLLSPDNALDNETLLGLLRGAHRSIDAQLLRADSTFRDGPNPYVEALVHAATRGVHVRVMLDDTFASEDNRRVRARLNAVAAARGLDLEARAAPPGLTLHNKGVVVDGETVVVGSLNWGEAAVSRNREAAILVRNEALATFFAQAFEADWRAPATGDRPAAMGSLAWVLGGIAGAARAAGNKRERLRDSSP